MVEDLEAGKGWRGKNKSDPGFLRMGPQRRIKTLSLRHSWGLGERRAGGQGSGWMVKRRYQRAGNKEMTLKRWVQTAALTLQDRHVAGNAHDTFKWPGQWHKVHLESHQGWVEVTWPAGVGPRPCGPDHCATCFYTNAAGIQNGRLVGFPHIKGKIVLWLSGIRQV